MAHTQLSATISDAFDSVGNIVNVQNSSIGLCSFLPNDCNKIFPLLIIRTSVEQMLGCVESIETWIKRFVVIASAARPAFTLEFLKFTIFMKVI